MRVPPMSVISGCKLVNHFAGLIKEKGKCICSNYYSGNLFSAIKREGVATIEILTNNTQVQTKISNYVSHNLSEQQLIIYCTIDLWQ